MASNDVVDQGTESAIAYSISTNANVTSAERLSDLARATGDQASGAKSWNNVRTIVDKFEIAAGDGTSIGAVEVVLMGSTIIPKNSTVVDCVMATSANGFTTVNLGDSGTPTRLFAGEDMSTATTVARCSTGSGIGYTYTEDSLLVMTILPGITDAAAKDITVILTITST